MLLSRRIQSVNESVTLALTAKAKALAAAGKDVVSLTAGELDFPPPAAVIEAMIDALRRGETRYTPASGTPALRAAIAEATARDLDGAGGLGFSPEQVIVCCGAKHALYNLIQVLCDPGDEVLIPSPYWLSYPAMAELAEARSVFLPCDAAFRLPPEVLERAIGPRSRVLVLNSPNNPTGAVWSEDDLRALAAVLRRHERLFVISDEIYDRLVYGERRGGRAPSLLEVAPDLAPRTIVVNGVSKTYAMTGLRIGWAVGPREVIGACGRLQSHSTSNPTSIAQSGAVAALACGHDGLAPIVAALEERRDRMVGALARMPGVSVVAPAGAFYCFASVAGVLGRQAHGRRLASAADVAAHLLEGVHVAVVPGDPFGAPDHIRLSFATSLAAIDQALERLAGAFAALAG